MPPATRLGDLCTGHDCWPSRPSVAGNGDVRIEGAAAHRVGDAWDVHCCVDRPTDCHAGVLAAGSGTVRINGRPAGRIGDPVSCGSVVATGAATVRIGG
ncbi:PAAR domain-containing protein [Fodinicurvata sp. EGI_FJ10296]|uniref:PAAR domain-containing protein n=1 Tax=Fodinicurvata sp. EGI_FJ10296 TaxID=3231908 RepID=UPI0034565257